MSKYHPKARRPGKENILSQAGIRLTLKPFSSHLASAASILDKEVSRTRVCGEGFSEEALVEL